MDFKSLREDELKLSVPEMADLCKVSPAQIKEWEKTSDPSSKALQAIVANTDLTLDDVLNYKKPQIQEFKVADTWEKADFTKKTLVSYIDENLDKVGLNERQRKEYVDDLQTVINQTIKKPRITIVGRSDTGKSTLINSLLGKDEMPTSWTPTTSIAVYIKHVKDKPAFIKDDVWVFASKRGDEKSWNEKKLGDEAYCTKWKIANGGIALLHEYGTRQGRGASDKTEAGSAVVFINSPILSNCDIVDLPGFGTEKESDDIITFRTAQQTDVLIYLSQANGFMRSEDITYLKENVRSLPAIENGENKLSPLANLLVVAAQAHNINHGNKAELKTILDSGCDRFLSSISDDYWNERTNITGITYTRENVRKRFVPYTTDIPGLCSNFENELKEVVEALPLIIDNEAKKMVKEYVEGRKPNLQAEIKNYEEMVTQRDKYIRLLQDIKDNELTRETENSEKVSGIREFIDACDKESNSEFSTYYAKTVNVDSIVELIKRKKIKNKKDDIENFGNWLSDTIRAKAESILKQNAEKVSGKITEYIQDYAQTISQHFEKSKVTVDFDAGYAFASAFIKIGVFGGYGMELVGTVAFLLGMGGMFATAAGTLGPIGVAVGLAVAAILGVLKLFGASWEKSVAKKLVAEYEKQSVAEKYRAGIKNYWKDTTDAFNKGVVELDKRWNEYVANLHNVINNYDIDEINDTITALRNLECFFEHIPL